MGREQQKRASRKKTASRAAVGGKRTALHKDSASLLVGRKPLLEVLKHSPARVERVFLAEGAKPPEDLTAVLEHAKGQGLDVLTVPREELDALAEDMRHQGCVAMLKPRPPRTLNDFLAARDENKRDIVLVLDQITDPHNLGAILRVADAAGVDAVVTTIDRSSPLTPAARKASAGASEFVELIEVKNLQRSLIRLKEHGFWLVGADISAESRSLYEADLPFPLALVLGSEGTGMRRLTRELCDVLVHLPMRGVIESINVSQAASVFLYELLRRRLS